MKKVLCSFLFLILACGPKCDGNTVKSAPPGPGKQVKQPTLAADPPPTRLTQANAVINPRPASYEVDGKPVKLQPNPDYCTAVSANTPADLAAVQALLKAGTKPLGTHETTKGTHVHILNRADLKPAADLLKYAASGKMPANYPGYLYNKAAVLVDGTVKVQIRKPNDPISGRGWFEKFMKQSTINVVAVKETPGLYTVYTEPGYTDPFSLADDLRKLKELEWAEPVLLVQIMEEEKPGAAKPPVPAAPVQPRAPATPMKRAN